MKDLRPNATSTSDKVKEEVQEEVQEERTAAAAAGGSVQPSNEIIKMTDGGPAASCDSLTPEEEHPVQRRSGSNELDRPNLQRSGVEETTKVLVETPHPKVS